MARTTPDWDSSVTTPYDSPIVTQVRTMEKKKDTRKENIQKLLVRLELWFAPLLIIMPMSVSVFFLWDWYMRGLSKKSSLYDGELILGLLLLGVNFIFDVLFLRSLRVQRKKEF
jgi:hypothetical protein